jgi:hypothetical protein
MHTHCCVSDVHHNDSKLVPTAWIVLRQLQRQLTVVLTALLLGAIKREVKLLTLTYCFN